MVSDQEPRYRLVDSSGNVVGSLFAESDGTLKLQEGTSGGDNELSVGTDGTTSAPIISTPKSIVGDTTGEKVTKEIDGKITTKAESITFNFTKTYDFVRLVFVSESPPQNVIDNGDELYMRVNGETGPDYDYTQQDGTHTSGDDRFVLVENDVFRNNLIAGDLYLWGNAARLAVTGDLIQATFPASVKFASGGLTPGGSATTGDTNTLDSVTLFTTSGSGNQVNPNVIVEGYTIA